jgi:hypothetical protein
MTADPLLETIAKTLGDDYHDFNCEPGSASLGIPCPHPGAEALHDYEPELEEGSYSPILSPCVDCGENFADGPHQPRHAEDMVIDEGFHWTAEEFASFRERLGAVVARIRQPWGLFEATTAGSPSRYVEVSPRCYVDKEIVTGGAEISTE